MKRQRVSSILLAALLLVLTAVPAASAAQALPESGHNYSHDLFQSWEYELDDAPYGVWVYFSQETCLEDVFADNTFAEKSGDFLQIDADTGRTVGVYWGDALSGAKIYVPTSGFRLTMVTDESVNAYGFRVTDVRAAAQDEVYSVLCHGAAADGQDMTLHFLREDPQTASWPAVYREGYYLAGWARTQDGPICYTSADVPPEGTRELWSVWLRLALGQTEVFSFNNSTAYFDTDGRRRYYMTPEDYRMVQRNLYRTFGASPYPTLLVSAVYASFPLWRWRGSCYGMSAATALQHFGKLDLLTRQGADCVSQLRPDKELVSLLNYYQTQVASSLPTENKAAVPGSALYKAQLRALYDSAAAGDLVMLSFFSGTPFLSTGHTVLITGAYTNEAGEHILIACDSNDPWSYQASETIDSLFVISGDWSQMWYPTEADNVIGVFQWTDRFSQFDAFDVGGNGSVRAWYRTFLDHLRQMFRLLFWAA